MQVSAPDKASIEAAVAKIRAIVAIPEVGEVYDAKVMSIMPYGCFVEFMPGREGLLHISEIAWRRLETVEEAGIKEGDMIRVKLLDIDEKTGKFRLSHRVLEENRLTTRSVLSAVNAVEVSTAVLVATVVESFLGNDE